VSSVSSNDSVPALLPRPTLLGQRYRGGGHKPTTSSGSTHIFPNEYSIPTIPLPPSSPSIHEGLKQPESPPRFRRREAPAENQSADSTPTKSPGGTTRDSSVRFALPEDLDGSLQFPLTSTPNPTSRTQQLLDQEANAYDSVKSFMSAYNTPSSPPRTAASRFRRTQQQTPAIQMDSPSKLLRTLSRATSSTPSTIAPLDQSSYNTPVSILQTPGLSIEEEEEEEEEELSMDEADKTLDSILESTEDASSRIRRVLDQSRRQRAIRQGNSPASTQEVSIRSIESPPPREVEMSVWGEKSFFQRMAKKAPGGWAFTPQPKFGRILHVHEEEKTVEHVEVYHL
jgi:hypothetical protein